ncbi:hypothetical protein V6Z11_A12G296200 [Gossypium hirsutum]
MQRNKTSEGWIIETIWLICLFLPKPTKLPLFFFFSKFCNKGWNKNRQDMTLKILRKFGAQKAIINLTQKLPQSFDATPNRANLQCKTTGLYAYHFLISLV